MYKVPVLLIIYNRVFETHDLFQIIKSLKPEKLYVAADGAIPDDRLDYINCLRARSVIMPEWNCDLHCSFQDEHLGKSAMVFQAVNWFFENEKEGVVIFDDCLPNMDFFPYCQELLEKYRDNRKVFHIGASNLERHQRKRNKKNKKGKDDSYYFSAYANTWGFATWKDRWEGFNLNMTETENVDFNKLLSNYMNHTKEKIYWLRRFNILRKHSMVAWEYQYNFHIWINNAYCIAPNLNLVTNVGFKSKKRKIKKLMKKSYEILPLKHPLEIIQDKKADRYMFKHVYNKAFITFFADWINEVVLGKEKKI